MRKGASVSKVLLLVSCALILLSGCGSYGGPPAHPYQEKCPYKPDWRADPAEKTRPTEQKVFKLSLTSQGEWVDRCDYTDLLLELQEEERPLTIMLYIHGWKHGPDSTDYQNFSKQVDLVGKDYENELHSVKPKKRRRVIGIYVGWPGSTISVPLLENLTYWGRQKAADRISQSGILAKILGGVQGVRSHFLDASTVTPPADQLILIGHSFGARILLTATSQLLISQLEKAHPGQRTRMFSGPEIHTHDRDSFPYFCIAPTPLVILLNPAVEAYTYSAFYNVRRGDHEFHAGQQPIMLVVASENDGATRVAFPVGQTLGLNWHAKELVTIGNYGPFKTHSLTRGGACPSRLHWFDSFKSSNDICLERSSSVQPSDLNGQSLSSSVLSGDNRYPSHFGNPYIVASTPPEVIDGHNGIWKPHFQRWLADFIRTANAERIANVCLGD